ncbi:AMP-dependent synthetase [Rhodococcus sp. 06-156-3C]|uniref:class I adenylate-forming enzyme family protein n=1 Tax=Nocardiaceae TaxID=85025 RepID=UPI00052305C5|nr:MULTISPECIES: class I adenylate-forming enzyme family protein [Rhodococcus]OZD13118.1 AMP-dependent synthetase [Rhodococcus sp. 06-156-4a]OZD17987.1 AMP-dependent synthetase [Rhodococcus sp. 06-156-3C]OZD20711.1 AMP-dependent synthetase [Rhodococcus sp. 06-156-4C]OZD30569.1 AMP-dependent synthetase [Rhodococcus sp. 06-156-3b]OZD32657.1 AMP-dependent synthetase [Rhodococcus sp. 06-156-3]
MTETHTWGSEIVPVTVSGVHYRMYSARPHRLGSLLELAGRWGDRPHIVQGENIMSFDDFRDAVYVRARELSSAGIGSGDRVVLLGFNSSAWIVNFWATVAVGGVSVLANAWWSDEELKDSLEIVGPTAVLADEKIAPRVPTRYAVLPWTTDSDADGANRAPVSDTGTSEEDPAVVIFTSGTSGKPKGVVLSHRSLLAGLQMLLHITRRLPHQVEDTAGEAALHTGPMFHVGGVQTLLRAICVGDTLVMPAGRFDAAEAMRLVEQWKIKRWSAVPTMVNRVLDHPDAQTRDLTTLKAVTVGGAPINAEFLERLRNGLPGVEPRIATGYGLTENGGQAVAASGKDTVKHPGTTGRALPCVDVSIAPRPDLPDGEILLRSPTQMLGYLGGVESPIDDEGWLHTGDLGHLDENGYLWITGRSKDMIIRGGENISPAAVEAALIRLPEIRDAVVFGLPHPDLGEEVVAVVVLSHPLDPASFGPRLKGVIASFAIPTRWVVAEEDFPTNHAGKVDKNAVVAQARPEAVSQ